MKRIDGWPIETQGFSSGCSGSYSTTALVIGSPDTVMSNTLPQLSCTNESMSTAMPALKQQLDIQIWLKIEPRYNSRQVHLHALAHICTTIHILYTYIISHTLLLGTCLG